MPNTIDALERESRERVAEYKVAPPTKKERGALGQIDMPEQDALERSRNFEEVTLGYSSSMARAEAMRCLQCGNAPCIKGCPVSLNIPAFLKATEEGDFTRGIEIIKEDSLLPSICGRVCPQEKQCMSTCTLGKMKKDPMKAVAIGRIERFLADTDREAGVPEDMVLPPATGKKVGIIGSGPASLTAAADCRRAGHEVVIFEAFHKAGGVLLYGIPEFRLPKAIVQEEIDNLEKMGVEIKTNFLIGRTRTVQDLREKDGFDALFIGTGAGLPKFMGIEGENLIGVFSANEYLTRVNLMKGFRSQADTPVYASNKVVVIGAGNVAMDAARTALRMGAREVTIVYRRTRNEMPAREEEIIHAEEEGIQFAFLTSPLKIEGTMDGQVCSMVCQRYELGEADESGRRRPIPVEGDTFTMETDMIIQALGNGSNPLLKKSLPGLKTNKREQIEVNEEGMTSIDGVYAGGDIVLGAATVILAMGEGRKAAAAINTRLQA